jgi:hypothetical protein
MLWIFSQDSDVEFALALHKLSQALAVGRRTLQQGLGYSALRRSRLTR